MGALPFTMNLLRSFKIFWGLNFPEGIADNDRSQFTISCRPRPNRGNDCLRAAVVVTSALRMLARRKCLLPYAEYAGHNKHSGLFTELTLFFKANSREIPSILHEKPIIIRTSDLFL